MNEVSAFLVAETFGQKTVVQTLKLKLCNRVRKINKVTCISSRVSHASPRMELPRNLKAQNQRTPKANTSTKQTMFETQ